MFHLIRWLEEYRPFINILKPTGHVTHHQFNIQQLYALPTLYLCVLYLSEKQRATCATYSINWLVFITEMKSVYSAVRTGYLNKAVWASSVKGLYVTTNVTAHLESGSVFVTVCSNCLV